MHLILIKSFSKIKILTYRCNIRSQNVRSVNSQVQKLGLQYFFQGLCQKGPQISFFQTIPEVYDGWLRIGKFNNYVVQLIDTSLGISFKQEMWQSLIKRNNGIVHFFICRTSDTTCIRWKKVNDLIKIQLLKIFSRYFSEYLNICFLSNPWPLN